MNFVKKTNLFILLIVSVFILRLVFWDVAAYCLNYIWGSCLTLSDTYKGKGIWELIASVASMVTVVFAAFTAFQANKTIKISHMEFVSNKTPALLYSYLPNQEAGIFQNKMEYRFDLEFVNHGRTIALLREIESTDPKIQYNLSPPISVGVGESTKICIIHSKDYIDDILKEFSTKALGNYDHEFWKVKVIESENFENTLKTQMLRDLKFGLLYWNIDGDCYKTEIEITVTIERLLNIRLECFINSEKCVSHPERNIDMPHKIINYDGLNA